MWKLIIPAIAIVLSIKLQTQDIIILVIDDCQNWTIRNLNPKLNHFGILKNDLSNQEILIVHAWKDENDSLDVISKTISEIKKFDFLYSSQMESEQWIKIASSKAKIFVLLPNEYCSENRFYYNFKFKLYEVKVGVSGIH
jgi:hypothetical protein